ncbi:MAG: hypothetical protein GWN31_02150 [Candidatus Thorarchaeota archaeon]|nr:hypothetical protein [Candidatus Thorarchaeota archaeon]NIW12742.1 hypothetical protein [Candidatus Thorarchaeota archaeon]NIW50950.1 hypothetical protein [Candidatus Korarchaeota archaeon]
MTFSEKIQLRKDILALFWADYPLEDFYNVYSCDPYFKKIFSALNGLRVMKPGNISWSLIEAICSQNTTVEQVRKRNRLFRTHYGQKVLFEDDDVFYTFPNLSTIAKLTEEELREYCNVGYRAKYILNAARAFTERELMSLKQMSSKTARRRLMQIKGIGPKVADVFLLYGLGMPDVFPMDVHLKRGLKREYFHGRKVSKKTLRNFALEKFGTHAGFAHLHMFYWERHQEISG